MVGFCVYRRSYLTLLGPQPRFGGILLTIWVVCPQNGTAALKGLTWLPAIITPNNEQDTHFSHQSNHTSTTAAVPMYHITRVRYVFHYFLRFVSVTFICGDLWSLPLVYLARRFSSESVSFRRVRAHVGRKNSMNNDRQVGVLGRVEYRIERVLLPSIPMCIPVFFT